MLVRSPSLRLSTALLLLLTLTLTVLTAVSLCAAQPTIVQTQSQHVHIQDSNEVSKNEAVNTTSPSTPLNQSWSLASPSSSPNVQPSGIPLSQTSTTVIELIPVQQTKLDTVTSTPSDSSSMHGSNSKSKLVAIAVEPEQPFAPPSQQPSTPALAHDESNQQSSLPQKAPSSSSSAPASETKQESVKSSSSSSPLSATEQELQQPITSKQKLKMSDTANNSIAPPLSPAVRSKLRLVKRRALKAQGQLIDDQFDLAGDNAADFGITPTTPLYEAILSHGDLSIPAFHLSVLPFLQPFVNLMQSAPCNLTAILPASSAIWQQADYYLNKHCGKDSKLALSGSCRTFNHLHKLDDVVVDNGYEVAANGLGNVQFTQMRVVSKLMKDAIQRFLNWNAQQPEGKKQVCDGETVFLPKVSDLQSVMDFVALKSLSTSTQKQQPSDDSRTQSPPSSSSSFSSDDNVDLLALQWKLQQLRQSNIADDSDDTDSVTRPLAAKLKQRIKTNLKKRAKAMRECVTATKNQQQVDGGDKKPSVDNVDCPQPPYTPSSDASDFPSSSDQQQPSSDSDSTLPPSFQRLQFRVRPYRVSAFMQRAIQALVSYHMLGFSAVTTDMPVHLFAPTLLNDPMFINFGNGWSNTSNTNTSTTTPSPAQPQQSQQVNTELQDSKQSNFSTTSASFPFHTQLNQRQLNWPMKLRHSNIQSNAFQFDSSTDSNKDAEHDSDSNTDSSSSSAFSSFFSRRRRLDALIDIAIAHAFAVTPQEVNATFDIAKQPWFAPNSNSDSNADQNQSTVNTTGTVTTTPPQQATTSSIFPATLHFEKSESGVFIKMGAETAVWPAQAKIISPDIRVGNGVIQIVDNAFFAPPKSTRVLRKNGVFAFGAAVRSVSREVADVVNYASGITLFVPQDSALAPIVAQLPDALVKKLIKDVAKFKLSKLKINRMKNEKKFSKDEDAENAQSKQLSKQPSSNSDSAVISSSDESLQHQSDFNLDANTDNVNVDIADADTSSSTSSDDDSQADSDSDTDGDNMDGLLRSKLKQRLKQKMKMKMKLKMAAARIKSKQQQMKMKWNSSGNELDVITTFNSTSRLGQLATALRSLKATVPFDLAAWCQANGVDIDQQQSQQQQQSSHPQQSSLTSAQLSALLLSHVFVGITPSSEFSNGKSLQSIAGGNSVTISCNGDNWSIGGANILFTDILTKNGMVHIIDRVIGGQQLADQSNIITPMQMKLISGFDFSDRTAVSTDDDGSDDSVQDAKLMKLKIALASHWAAKHRLLSHGWRDIDDNDNDDSNNNNNNNNSNNDDDDDVNGVSDASSVDDGNGNDTGNDDDNGNDNGNGGGNGNGNDDDDTSDDDWDSDSSSFSARRRLLARLLARYLRLKNKLKQKMKQKLKQKLKSKWSGVNQDSSDDTVGSIISSDCLFRRSRHCAIVDTLQFNPPFQSMRQSSRALFSASNAPSSTQCSSDTDQQTATTAMNGTTSMKLKSYSSDYFSLPTISKCYSPREYVCRQGKLILKKSIKQRITEARALLRLKIRSLKAKLKQAMKQ